MSRWSGRDESLSRRCGRSPQMSSATAPRLRPAPNHEHARTGFCETRGFAADHRPFPRTARAGYEHGGDLVDGTPQQAGLSEARVAG